MLNFPSPAVGGGLSKLLGSLMSMRLISFVFFTIVFLFYYEAITNILFYLVEILMFVYVGLFNMMMFIGTPNDIISAVYFVYVLFVILNIKKLLVLIFK